ncbi:MAG: response regulator [Cryomorphaceae bacterium]|nr:response regulator [Cryomorphaceae bacterium]
MNCLIIEDEKLSREALFALCDKVGGMTVEAVENVVDARKILSQKTFDLVLLDIGLPDINGVEFLRIGMSLPPVIIISSNEKYALEAFELDVVDYLKKPVSLSRFIQAIDRFKARTAIVESTVKSEKEENIFVKSEGKIIRIPLDDLLVLESMRDYVIFRMEKGKHLVHTTMKNVEEQLKDDDRFIRVHRSFIINRSQISDIQENSVLVHSHVIPVSRSHRSILMEKIKFI